MKLADVKFLPMRGKDYDEGKIIGSPWMNFPEHSDWMQKYCSDVEFGGRE